MERYTVNYPPVKQMCMCKICDFFVCFAATYSCLLINQFIQFYAIFLVLVGQFQLPFSHVLQKLKFFFLILMHSYLCVCIEKIKPIVATSYAFFRLMQMHMNPTAAESTILALRQSPSPYQLCQFILGRFTLASPEVIFI